MRSQTIKDVRFDFAAGTPSLDPVSLTWPDLTSETSYSPENTTSDRVNGVSIEEGRLVRYTVGIDRAGEPGVYTGLYVRAATGDTATDLQAAAFVAEDWPTTPMLLDEGTIDHRVEARAIADMKPLYRRTGIEALLMPVMQTGVHPALTAVDGELVDIALKRSNGTYRYIAGVHATYTPFGPSGADRTQVGRLRLAGSSWSPGDLVNAIVDAGTTNADLARLVAAMTEARAADVRFTHEDAGYLVVEDSRFTVSLRETIGAAARSALLVEGVGYAVDNSVVTINPALT